MRCYIRLVVAKLQQAEHAAAAAGLVVVRHRWWVRGRGGLFARRLRRWRLTARRWGLKGGVRRALEARGEGGWRPCGQSPPSSSLGFPRGRPLTPTTNIPASFPIRTVTSSC
jgi:hypothetical protein